MNARRIKERADLDQFHKKGTVAQSTAFRSNEDVGASTIIEEGIKDMLYGQIDRIHPGMGSSLKTREAALIQLQSQIEKRVGELADKQADIQGRSFREKRQLHVTVSSHGRPHAYMGLFHGEQPLTEADLAMQRAFESRTARGRLDQIAGSWYGQPIVKTIRGLPIVRLTDPSLLKGIVSGVAQSSPSPSEQTQQQERVAGLAPPPPPSQ